MSVPTTEQLKARSKHLAKLLQEKFNVKVSHGQCLDVVAQLFGHKDWNTASAFASSDDSPKVDSNRRQALIEALIQGFHLRVEQPYKREKYFVGGSRATHTTEQGSTFIDPCSVQIDPQTRNVTVTLPTSMSVTTSDAVIDMNKQLYLERETYFAEQLGGKAEDLTTAKDKA